MPEEAGPGSARDPAEFVARMRELKRRSGLSYRQLEERAAARGEVLARSTIADGLRKDALPRPDVLGAFVRACGAGPAETVAWLEARERLAAEPVVTRSTTEPATEPAATPAPEPPRKPARRVTRGRLAVLVAVLALLLGAGAWALWPGDEPADDGPAAAFDVGWYEIRPARTPELCVTEGRERTGRYGSAVATQQPCAEIEVPRVALRPAWDGFHYIEWHHPEEGRGCLTVMRTGSGTGLLEPRDDCVGEDIPEQLFRFEPVAGAPDTYRVRTNGPDGSDECLGILDDEETAGAEVVETPCAEGPAQQFVVAATGQTDTVPTG
ncbi:XRE family transcriptional regulator [Streptomyces sp. 8K308]|uniref:helix-turn-helix domain-containing protein n=1 Tax=Streptomyces sp. 8K308 TaxID=2530388 RepID=UPI00104C6B95|nr:helix-turn-helix transcriptional regulator [Streptomyces sp. 8K308]TDC23095.1 XRE family transcriptional regulator [Streptomyces sp. 8K308]